MKHTMLACTILVCATLGWAQYSTNYTWGVYDVTSYLSTYNAWHALMQGGPGGQICHIAGAATLTEGIDGYIACIGPGQYIYSTTAQGTWTEHTEMGNTRGQVTASSANAIYSIGSTPCSLGKWNGATWAGFPGCLTYMQAVPDGALVGINSPYTYLSVKGDGSDWQPVAGGNNFTYVYAADKNSMCGIGSNGHVYTYSRTASTFVQMPTQPSGTMKGCTLGQNQSILLAWSTSGAVSIYNFTAGTWSTVMGLSASEIVTAQKAMTLALDLQGHPYHLNIYAAYHAATTHGSYNGCPTQPCQGGATHTLTIKATLPGGLFGAQNLVQGSPSAQLSVTSYDVGIGCDPFFGDPADPNCVPSDSGLAHCDVSGANLGTPGPVPTLHSGIDAVGATGAVLYESATAIPVGWAVTQGCSAPINGCALYTTPFCPSPNVVEQDVIIFGDPTKMTAAQAEGLAAPECELEGGAPNAWKVYEEYEDNDPTTCTAYRTVAVPLGSGTIDCF